MPGNRPVLDRPHFRGRKVAFDPVSVDFADRRRQRSQFRSYTLGQIDVAQSLEHLLPGKIRVNRIVERDGNERQSKLCVRKETNRMRNSAQTDLDWNRDLLFDFFSGAARKQSDDLNLGIGDIRKRLDRQRSEGRHSTCNEERHQQNQEERLVQRESNETFDHFCLFPIGASVEQQNAARHNTIFGAETFFNNGAALNLSSRHYGTPPESSGRLFRQDE